MPIWQFPKTKNNQKNPKKTKKTQKKPMPIDHPKTKKNQKNPKKTNANLTISKNQKKPKKTKKNQCQIWVLRVAFGFFWHFSPPIFKDVSWLLSTRSTWNPGVAGFTASNYII